MRFHFAAGQIERAGDRLYNAAGADQHSGDLRPHHRKINEPDIALVLYSEGDWRGIVGTEIGTLGLAICADNFGSSLAIGHVLARRGRRSSCRCAGVEFVGNAGWR